MSPDTTTTTTTTIGIPTTATSGPESTTTIAGAPAADPSKPAGDLPIGTQETVKTAWSGDTANLTGDQQKENSDVASYVVKDLFISSSLPLPTNPVEVDGLLTIDGSPDRVQGAVTGTSSGYGPGATGHLYAASQPIHLGAFTADAQGVIHFDVTVPSKLTGAHHLVMVGNNPAGNVKASVLSVTIIGGIGPDAAATPTGPAPSTNSTTVPAVKAAVAPNQLAITGADLFGLVFAAAAFIVAGALTLRRNRARSLSCDEIAHGH